MLLTTLLTWIEHNEDQQDVLLKPREEKETSLIGNGLSVHVRDTNDKHGGISCIFSQIIINQVV